MARSVTDLADFPWLNRFLWGLALAVSVLAVALASINVYHSWLNSRMEHEVSLPDGSGLAKAAELGATPHPFAGYVPWKGQGSTSARERCTRIAAEMESTRPFSREQIVRLIHSPSCYLAAAAQAGAALKMSAERGDGLIIGSMAERNQAAIRSMWVFVAFLCLISAIMWAVWYRYRTSRILEPAQQLPGTCDGPGSQVDPGAEIR